MKTTLAFNEEHVLDLPLQVYEAGGQRSIGFQIDTGTLEVYNRLDDEFNWCLVGTVDPTQVQTFTFGNKQKVMVKALANLTVVYQN